MVSLTHSRKFWLSILSSVHTWPLWSWSLEDPRYAVALSCINAVIFGVLVFSIALEDMAEKWPAPSRTTDYVTLPDNFGRWQDDESEVIDE